MSYLIEEYLLDAVAVISGWEDVPDEDFAEILYKQVIFMAQINIDDEPYQLP
jgi:hypothetical protein